MPHTDDDRAFHCVGLVARSANDPVVESLGRILLYLLNSGVTTIIEDSAATLLGLEDDDVAVCSREAMGERCDLVIAVGGDGNILGAARALSQHGVPILGVNRGKLGFLADVLPEEVEQQIGAVLAGDFTVEEHFLLQGEVSVEGETHIPVALNEVVVHATRLPKMLEFDLYVDDIFVYNQYSDGLIISSPTGSTAYALSAGGPIMHPALDAITLVPMFPHTLNSRPLVVKGDSVIRVEIGSHIDSNAIVSFDSQIEFEIRPGDSLLVRKKARKLKLVHPPGHDFFGVCRAKLDWASRVGE